MWRLIGAASLLAFFTIQGSAPSSINNDLPTLFPENKRVKHGKLFRNGQIKTQIKLISTEVHGIALIFHFAHNMQEYISEKYLQHEAFILKIPQQAF